MGWKHSSELNSCLFKQVVVEGTLGLVTCCQHIENEATMSHGIDSEGSSYLVTGHIDPALVNLATLYIGMFRLEQEPLLPGAASPLVPHQRPQTAPAQCNYSSLTLVTVSQLSFRQTGPHAGADTELQRALNLALPKGIFGREVSLLGVLSLKAVAPEWKSTPGDARCLSG